MSKNIYFAGGCFWGTERVFKEIPGVIETTVGYANGRVENPSYEQVAEVILAIGRLLKSHIILRDYHSRS